MARSIARLSVVGSILAGMTLLAPLGVAHAQTKIAVVNVPRLLDEAPQAKSAMQALQDEFAPRQREIVQQQKDGPGHQQPQGDGDCRAHHDSKENDQGTHVIAYVFGDAT